TRTFTYSLLSPLTVTVSGPGTVTAGYLGTTMQQTGATITLTATPVRGSFFDRWTGDIESLSPTITFEQDANITLKANFIANPFSSLAATYSGLITPGAGGFADAGSFSATVTTTGGLTATVVL